MVELSINAERIVELFVTEKITEDTPEAHNMVSRWSIYGNVNVICKELKARGIYKEWMRDFLQLEHDMAEDSI